MTYTPTTAIVSNEVGILIGILVCLLDDLTIQFFLAMSTKLVQWLSDSEEMIAGRCNEGNQNEDAEESSCMNNQTYSIPKSKLLSSEVTEHEEYRSDFTMSSKTYIGDPNGPYRHSSRLAGLLLSLDPLYSNNPEDYHFEEQSFFSFSDKTQSSCDAPKHNFLNETQPVPTSASGSGRASSVLIPNACREYWALGMQSPSTIRNTVSSPSAYPSSDDEASTDSYLAYGREMLLKSRRCRVDWSPASSDLIVPAPRRVILSGDQTPLSSNQADSHWYSPEVLRHKLLPPFSPRPGRNAGDSQELNPYLPASPTSPLVCHTV